MNIPSCITSAIKKDVFANDYFYGADQLWERLTEVRRGRVKYINADMSMLANCVELYYKGLLYASKVKVPEDVMKESHSLLRLTDEIETKICPLQYNMTLSERRDRKNFLIDLGAKYITCRYHNEQVSREDFCKCYDWAKGQKEIIKEILAPNVEKDIVLDDDEYER